MRAGYFLKQATTVPSASLNQSLVSHVTVDDTWKLKDSSKLKMLYQFNT